MKSAPRPCGPRTCAWTWPWPGASRATTLTIHQGPLPWPGNLTLHGRELSQLYGQEVIVTGKNRQRSSTYSLLALDRAGRKVKLLSGLKDKDQVLYLEQALERRLGIEDSPVDGEVATRTHAG